MNKKTNKKRTGVNLKSPEKSAEIAYYYGFTHAGDLIVEKEDREITKKCLEIKEGKVKSESTYLTIYPEEKVALLRTFLLKNPRGDIQPTMIYHENTLGTPRKHSPDEKKFHLDIVGTVKSIAEAVLIKTTIEILKEEGFDNLMVEINSIGDRESTSGFMRDVVNYYKKNLADIPAHCRQTFKNDPFDMLTCQNEKCKMLSMNAPNPIDSLSENSRKHFGEVLEYLEALKIPYRISNNLLHSRKLCSGTIFEIKDSTSDTPLAFGIRYNALSKKMGFKKELGSVGVFACYKKEKSIEKKKRVEKIKSPKVYFIQLGFDAKLKSLEIVEILRKEKIPLAQGLVKDKLAPQLQIAENIRIPYTIIMGQKEAVENSIIVRNMATRSQETIPIDCLAAYLKKIKI